MTSAQMEDIDTDEIDDELFPADGTISTDSARVCREVLDYGPRKGKECGGVIIDVRASEEPSGTTCAERICQSCGTVYGSSLSVEKPYNRKPTGAILFDLIS